MIFQSGQQNIVLTSMVVNNVEERFILCRFHTCFCFVSFPVPEENEKKIFFPLTVLIYLVLSYFVGLKIYRKSKYRCPCTDLSSLVAQMVKRLPTMWETWVQSLGCEDLLEKEMATHSSILPWKIPWMEEPGGLQSMGLQRVGHDWATSLHLYWLGTNNLDFDNSRLHVENI